MIWMSDGGCVTLNIDFFFVDVLLCDVRWAG